MSMPLPDVTCPKCYLRQMYRRQTACIHRGCQWNKRQLAQIKREARRGESMSALQAQSERLGNVGGQDRADQIRNLPQVVFDRLRTTYGVQTRRVH